MINCIYPLQGQVAVDSSTLINVSKLVTEESDYSPTQFTLISYLHFMWASNEKFILDCITTGIITL